MKTIYFIFCFLIVLTFNLCTIAEEEPSIKKSVSKGEGDTIITTTSESTTSESSSTESTTSDTTTTTNLISIIGTYSDSYYAIQNIKEYNGYLYFIAYKDINGTQYNSSIHAINLSNAINPIKDIEINPTHLDTRKISSFDFHNQAIYFLREGAPYLYIYNLLNYTNSTQDIIYCEVISNYLKIEGNTLFNSLSPMVRLFDITSTPTQCFTSNSLGFNINKSIMSSSIVFSKANNVIISNNISTTCSISTNSYTLLPSPIYSITKKGNYIYAICGFNGIQIVDVSDPSNMLIVGSAPVMGNADGDIAIYNNYVIVTENGYGIEFFDLTNPISPQKVAYLNTIGHANEIAISPYGYACVLDSTSSIIFIDITSLQ